MQVEKAIVRFPKRATLATILSKAANLEQSIESLMRDEYAQFLEYTPQVNKLGRLYHDYKKANQLMDYDDLILFFRQLLMEHEELRRDLSQQYGYIMVDEYQDTNGIQADIVKWLASIHRNVMVVGDDSQSIYSFRGANYKNMFDFPKQFPEATIIKLEENYRSTQPILTFTNALMDQALEKYTKCLFTQRIDGEMPKVIDTGTQQEQALLICHAIKEQLSQGRPMREIAVLFRAAYHSFELELELARQGIPFVKYGGFKFMESAHIKDLLAHLRILVNRSDTVSLGRVLRLVKRIGQRKSQSIIDWMRNNGTLPRQVAEWPGAHKDDEGLKALSHLFQGLGAKGLRPEKAVELAMEYYYPVLKQKYDDFPQRQKDLEQLIPMASRYKRLRAFLDDLTLEPPTSLVDIDFEQKGDRLTLSTVHSAKGLEWSTVFIICVIEGYFPSARAHSNEAAIEEERRLMYVAATRAKDHLILCYPAQEGPPAWTTYHSSAMGYGGNLSSFIRALPEEVAEFGSFKPVGRRYASQFPVQESSPHHESYRDSSNLRPGDRVNHPAFGQGVVSKIMDKEKVEVLFRDVGRKLLHLEYTTLEKI
jgi:DNA helicase-2/ATP-dependent DNA helicase PcrA